MKRKPGPRLKSYNTNQGTFEIDVASQIVLLFRLPGPGVGEEEGLPEEAEEVKAEEDWYERDELLSFVVKFPCNGTTSVL